MDSDNKDTKQTRSELENRYAGFDLRKGLRDDIKRISEAWATEQVAKGNRLALTISILVQRKKTFLTASEFAGYIRHVTGVAAPGDSSTVWGYVHNAPRIAQLFADGLIDEKAMRYSCALVRSESVPDSEGKAVEGMRWARKDGTPDARAWWFNRRARTVRAHAQEHCDETGNKLSSGWFVKEVNSYLLPSIDTKALARSESLTASAVALHAIKSNIGLAKGERTPPIGDARDKYTDSVVTLAQRIHKTLVDDKELEALRASADAARRWNALLALGAGTDPTVSDSDYAAICEAAASLTALLAITT